MTVLRFAGVGGSVLERAGDRILVIDIVEAEQRAIRWANRSRAYRQAGDERRAKVCADGALELARAVEKAAEFLKCSGSLLMAEGV